MTDLNATKRIAANAARIAGYAAKEENTILDVSGVRYRVEPRDGGRLTVYRIKQNSDSSDSILLGRAADATEAARMIAKNRETV